MRHVDLETIEQRDGLLRTHRTCPSLHREFGTVDLTEVNRTLADRCERETAGNVGQHVDSCLCGGFIVSTSW